MCVTNPRDCRAVAVSEAVCIFCHSTPSSASQHRYEPHTCPAGSSSFIMAVSQVQACRLDVAGQFNNLETSEKLYAHHMARYNLVHIIRAEEPLT